MRRLLPIVLTCAVAVAAGSCNLPHRDNPNDPTVKPIAVIGVSVDGAPGSAGGRSQNWDLDGSQSIAPAAAVSSWSWSLSSTATSSPDAAQFVDIGSGAHLLSSSTAFHDALLAIDDFSGGDTPGTGATTRWVRLVVHDRARRSGEATALISIVNSAPVLSLGPSLRIAPGGKWWTATGGVLSAKPWDVTLTAQVAPDRGDEALVFTAANPGRWRVTGPLTNVLDVAPRDGYVDDAFLVPGTYGRQLRFPAPILPERNVLIAEAGDAPGQTSSASVRVDVLSSVWSIDADGLVSRVDTSRFDPRIEVNSATNRDDIRPLASNGTELLAGNYGVRARCELYDPVLKLVRAGVGDQGIPTAGVGDGVGGWWAFEVPPPNRLAHFASDTSILANAPEYTDTADDFTGQDASSTLASIPGSDAVWALAPFVVQSNGIGISDAVLRATPSGTTRYSPFNGGAVTAITADGAGGLFAAGRSVAHVLADGTVDPTFAMTLDSAGEYARSISYDPVGGSLWVLQTNLYDSTGHLFHRSASGSVVRAAGTGLEEIIADPGADDTATVFFDDTVTGVEHVDASLTVIGERVDDNGAASEAALALDGGSLFDGYWYEAGEPTLAESILIDPGSAASASIALDAARGDLWLFRPDHGELDRYSADGALLSSLPIGPLDTDVSSAIAIDAEARRVLFAWSGPTLPGQLLSIPIPDDPAGALSATALPVGGPVSISFLYGIAADATGGYCLSVTDSSSSTYAFRVDGAGTRTDFTGATPFVSVFGDERGCWMIDSSSPQHGRYSGPLGTSDFTLDTTDSRNTAFQSAMSIADVASAGDRLVAYAPNFDNPALGSTDDSILSLSTNGSIVVSRITWENDNKPSSQGGDAINGRLSYGGTWLPLYDHFLTTFVAHPNAEDGGVMRFNLDAIDAETLSPGTREASRSSGGVVPVSVAAPH